MSQVHVRQPFISLAYTTLTLLLASLTAPALAQQVVLRWKWSPGDERRHIIESTFVQKTEYDRTTPTAAPGSPTTPPARTVPRREDGRPDGPRTIHCTQILHVVERVVLVDDSGVATVTQTYERVQVRGTDTADIVAETFEYDSAPSGTPATSPSTPASPRQSPRQRLQRPSSDPQPLAPAPSTMPFSRDAPDHPLIRPFAALAGRTITYRIDPEGRVLSCEGGDAAGEAVFSFLQDSPAGLLGAIFAGAVTDESLARQCEQGLAIIPNAVVRQGATWNVDIAQTLPLVGTLRSQVKCRLSSVRGRLPAQTATITNSGGLVLEGGEGGADALGGLFQVHLNSSSMQGSTEFDVEGGFVRSQRQRMVSEWEVYAPDWENPDNLGAPVKITQRIEQDMSMRLEP